MVATRLPTQARAHKSRAAIIEAAAAEFSAQGYAQTTSKSIAARAGVATGSFYQYFHDKDQALAELAKTRLQHIVSANRDILSAAPHRPEDAPKKLSAILDLVMRYHAADPGLHVVMTERRHADPAIDALFSESEHAIVADIEAALKVWRPKQDHRATAFILFSMLEGSVHAHVLGQPFVSDKKFREALVNALLLVALNQRPPHV